LAFAASLKTALLLTFAAVVVSAVLAVAPATAASAACETDTCLLIHNSRSIELVRYRGTSGAFALFDVLDVLKGPAARTDRVRANYFSPYSPRGTWLLVLGPDFSPIFRVSASGAVKDLFTGEGEPHDYPTTLAAWYRALGLRPPDTATASAAATTVTPGTPLVLLASAAILGALLALRRASKPRQGARC